MNDVVLSGSHAVARGVWMRRVVLAAALLAIAHLIDGWAFRHLNLPGLAGKDFGRMLRVMGFVPFWLTAALALYLVERPIRWRAAALACAPIAAGIVAEVLKLLFRRERPRAHGGEYVFRPWSEDPFSTGGLALPSSHAMVAFGAAAVLARLFPQARVVWYALAVGCALSRVAAGAHFVSDVALSWIAAEAVVLLAWPRISARATSPAGSPPPRR